MCLVAESNSRVQINMRFLLPLFLPANDGKEAVNDTLLFLSAEISTRAATPSGLDAFGHYLSGLVLLGQQNKAGARLQFAHAASAYPLLWSAWHELVASCVDAAEAAEARVG